ncbi:hypothetical protein PMAC_002791, partial [Pneumocystis sp. 'macacae']
MQEIKSRHEDWIEIEGEIKIKCFHEQIKNEWTGIRESSKVGVCTVRDGVRREVREAEEVCGRDRVGRRGAPEGVQVRVRGAERLEEEYKKKREEAQIRLEL